MVEFFLILLNINNKMYLLEIEYLKCLKQYFAYRKRGQL